MPGKDIIIKNMSWTEILSGWGKYPVSTANVHIPGSIKSLANYLKSSPDSAILARGKGRSYGDASLNEDNSVLSMDRLDSVIEFDKEKGIFTSEGGMILDDITRIILPYGWFLPVTPGTSAPSIGGCLACDVHGKNHHQAGTISKHVLWIDLLCADGKTIRCDRKKNTDIFKATAGGMGLTGIITRICLQLLKVESSYIIEESLRTKSLRSTMDLLTQNDTSFPYSVAWIDCISDKNALGRGEVLLGRHAGSQAVKKSYRKKQAYENGFLSVNLPINPPVSIVNKLSGRIFNETKFRFFSNFQRKRVIPYDVFFYPLDRIKNWNTLYGSSGFVQYQFVVPFDAGRSAIEQILRKSYETGHVSTLAVLKRLGESAGLLSFPSPGWTLALDIPIRPGLFALLDDFDRLVADFGGKVYLAKDARLSPSMFRRMYPEFGEWLKVKHKIDPDNMFQSDLSRRLRLFSEV